MEKIVRKYKGKDTEMLIVLSIIVGFVLDNIIFLSTKRSNWNKKFFDDLSASIDALVKKHTGYDSALALRNATTNLMKIYKPAYQSLSEFKVQVEEDFKKDKPFLNELLLSLGFSNFFKGAQDGDQEAMIQLLYRFSTNITPAQKTAIIAKGMMPQLITDIMGYADTLTKANISQEQIKGSRTENTGNRIIELNNKYDEVEGICKIIRRFYTGQPLMLQLYSYSKVLKGLNAQGGQNPPPPPPTK